MDAPANAGPSARRPRRRLVAALAVGAAAVLGAWKGEPWVRAYWTHVSTDDAFVTGDASTVPSRVADVVERVLVHDNDYVERGTLLVQLDREPYQILVEQKRSDLQQARLTVDRMVRAVDAARAGIEQEQDLVRSSVAALEEAWRAVEGQQEQVRYRVASLRAEAATLRAARAELILAQRDHERIKNLVADQTGTREELDQKLAALQGAREKLKAAAERVQQARALLALPPDYQHPEQVPADLERTATDVRRAVAAGEQILAKLGLAAAARDLQPESLHRALRDLTARTTESWLEDVPSVRAARAQFDQAVAMLGGPSFDPARPYQHPAVVKAQKELAEAELRLGYTEIRAPVSGFVNRRAVNPGDSVQAGQGLMSIQPLEDVYIVANFKETQVADLTIGQPAEIAVDAYPGRTFRGRVSGFAPATGAASSMLPPENATGNFVKVVQRIPVRIDLVDPNPREAPLLVGMSVVPVVDIKAQPDGPDAGGRLRTAAGRTPYEEVRR
ncbi:MAG TPA: HlyD family secretion protein [Isosphaeraceae bacterium]|nr:HlyD family secretion protein [Isosphaeraceae bacterium]